MPKCPQCNVPLCRIEKQRVPVHTCPDCGGELIEQLRLKAVERRAEPDWTEPQKDDFCRLADASNNLAEVLCPRCGRYMRKFLFRNYAHLQVDQCPECRTYWLDAGEMEKMQILYQEMRQRYEDEDWKTLEKLGRSQVAMDARKARLADVLNDPGTPSAYRLRVLGGGSAGGGSIGGAALAGLLGVLAVDQALRNIDAEADAAADQTFDVRTRDELQHRPWYRRAGGMIGLLVALAFAAAGLYAALAALGVL